MKVKGINGYGNSKIVKTAKGTPRQVAERLLAAGWKWVCVYDDNGELVAGSRYDPEVPGARVPWGE